MFVLTCLFYSVICWRAHNTQSKLLGVRSIAQHCYMVNSAIIRIMLNWWYCSRSVPWYDITSHDPPRTSAAGRVPLYLYVSTPKFFSFKTVIVCSF